ncbi:MAG: hypothetical protein HYT49_02580 [Candidatus Wildermuthbacteria bacterium]|nr:hypothetical protein [Candidatus Wildermuthbacteria bacterium]
MRTSPKNETKQERFKRLAALRTNQVLERLRVLGNCGNRGAYEYSEEEVNKIFSEIERGTREAKIRFHLPKKSKFTF